MAITGQTIVTDKTGGMPVPRSVSILGVRVDDVTNTETLHLIESYIKSGRKHHVATVNPEFIMEARRNQEFMNTLNSTSLSFPDGVGVLYASRLVGRALRERVAGVDIVENIASLSAVGGYSIFLLGSAPGVAESTGEILMRRAPGLRIAGTFAGSPSPGEEADICSRINAVQPDILLVAYGAPKQDLWISRNLNRLDISVAMGVGGTFDFITGKSRRAPVFVRKAGFEWLHRLILEPSRWRRMLALPRFAVACIVSAVTSRRKESVDRV